MQPATIAEVGAITLRGSGRDGADVRGYDEGRGRTVVLLGPGLDDGTRTRKLARILAQRFRVVRLHRRQYRLDLKSAARGAYSISREVDDAVAVARDAGEPVLVYGHSSGAVVALEALVGAPALFAGAVIYEPPTVIGTPLAGAGGAVLARARAALSAGRVGKAMEIFAGEVVGLPSWQAWAAGMVTGLIPRYRRLAACQLDDVEAIDRLGVRLDAYAQVTVPTLLLGGDKSPANLVERLDALERVLPDAERVVMRGRDHGADVKAAREVAGIVTGFADRVFGGSV